MNLTTRTLACAFAIMSTTAYARVTTVRPLAARTAVSSAQPAAGLDVEPGAWSPEPVACASGAVARNLAIRR